MTSDFWWGMAILPIAAVGAAALLFGLHTVLSLTWRNDYINIKPKKYHDRALVGYVVARSDWVARIVFAYGFYIHVGRAARDVKRETFGEMDALRAALHTISINDQEDSREQ